MSRLAVRPQPARGVPRTQSPPSFIFLAARADGKRTIGVRSAGDDRALAGELRKDKLLLLRAFRVPGWLISRRTGLSLKDETEFTGQLAQLLLRGVPLVESLEVAAEAVSPRARPSVVRIREMVSQGRSFARAAVDAGAFDTVTASVFEAAERSGDLAGASGQLAQNAKRRLRIAETAKTLLFYPIIVLAISGMVGLFMLTIVVPMVADAMEDILPEGRSLPAATAALAAAGRTLRANPLPALIAVVGVLGAVVVLRARIGLVMARVARRLPFVRELVLAQESARFFSVMAAMSGGGVPLADALGVANQSVAHPALRGELDALRTGLIEGGLLRVLIDRVGTLPVATRRMLIAAERAGDLDAAFSTLAEDHTELVDRRSTRLLSVLEPLLIVAIFLIIGSMIVALIAPMLSMSQQAFG
jgi:type II secretory pathway component PulF